MKEICWASLEQKKWNFCRRNHISSGLISSIRSIKFSRQVPQICLCVKRCREVDVVSLEVYHAFKQIETGT